MHDRSRRIAATAGLPAHPESRSSKARSSRSRSGNGRRRQPAAPEAALQLVVSVGRTRHSRHRRGRTLKRRNHVCGHARTTALAAAAPPPARDRLRIAGRRPETASFSPCQGAVPLSTPRVLSYRGRPNACNGRLHWLSPAMDAENMAIEGPREACQFPDVSFRWNGPIRSDCVSVAGSLTGRSPIASVGGKMLSYIARASRMRRIRSRSVLETNPTISPICAPSGATGFEALPQQILWQITPDENKPCLARLLLLPGTSTSALNEHMDALNYKLPIVILD